MDLLNGAWKTYRLSMKGTGVIAEGKDFIIETMPPRLTFTRHGATEPESVALDELTGERLSVKSDANHLCEGRLAAGTADRRAIAGVIQRKDGTARDAFIAIEEFGSAVFSPGKYVISSARDAIHGKNLIIRPSGGGSVWSILLESWTAEGEPPSGDIWEPANPSSSVKFFLRAVRHKLGGANSFVGFVRSDTGQGPGDEDSFVAVRVGPPGEGDGEGDHGR
jgi:hypothetical protein